MNVPELFDTFTQLKVSAVALRAGINPSLLRQYRAGLKTPSKKQLAKLQAGLHAIAKEMIKARIT